MIQYKNNDTTSTSTPAGNIHSAVFEETEILSVKKKKLEDIYINAQLKKFDYDLRVPLKT